MNDYGGQNGHVQTAARKQSGRAVSSFDTTDDPDRREPSLGGVGRRHRYWTEMESRAESIRVRKLKNRRAIRPPHLRQSLGAVALKAVRYMPCGRWRDTNPALCTGPVSVWAHRDDWSPNFRTLNDFSILMGEGDASAQRVRGGAGGGARFCRPAGIGCRHDGSGGGDTVSERDGIDGGVHRVGFGSSQTWRQALNEFVRKAGWQAEGSAEEGARIPPVRQDQGAEGQGDAGDGGDGQRCSSRAGQGHRHDEEAEGSCHGIRQGRSGAVGRAAYDDGEAAATDPSLGENGSRGVRQIISLYMPELYSVVRGKVGKTVEFGLTWGFRRLRGGFVLATVATSKTELHDTKFAVSAVDEHIALFGAPPNEYGSTVVARARRTSQRSKQKASRR